MAFRLTSKLPATEGLSSFPVAATTGTRARMFFDGAATSGNHVSYVCWMYCEHDGSNVSNMGIWELSVSTTAYFNLYMDCNGSGQYTLRANINGATNAVGGASGYVLPINPVGKWLLVSIAWQNRTSAVSDRIYCTVYDPTTNTQYVAEAGGRTFVAAGTTIPDLAALGCKNGLGGSFQMAGIVMPSIRTDLVVDGNAGTDSVATVALSSLGTSARGLAGHISETNYATCVWAANYSAGNRNGGADDHRKGQVATASNHYVFDINGSIFVNRHQQSRGTIAVVGSPLSVDPYTFGTIGRPAYGQTTVVGDASPATSLTLSPSGRRGRNSTALAKAILGGTVPNGQKRVVISANSRAVYNGQFVVRLSDGTFLARKMKTNFCDMGLIGQASLYNDGRIVGFSGPVPTCQWTGTDTLEGAYGVDCETALPRCLNSVPAVVNPSAVFTSLVNSTLGSRFGLTSRTATSVPSSAGDANNYRGPHAAVRLAPSCTYRIMVRPENGLPVTDPLEIKLFVLKNPSCSSATYRKVVGASQSATEDSSSAGGTIAAPTVPTLKAITAVVAPSLTNQVTQNVFGSVTVDDTDNGFAALAVGDMVQLYDSANVSNVYNEAFLCRTVTGKGTSTCVISYQWLPRQYPIIGDKITFVPAANILDTMTVTFTANEVAAGKWRGIEVVAGASGDGLTLWGMEFRNTTRPGFVVMPVGRSGCGYWIQVARWPTVVGADGQSLTSRIMDILAPDLWIATTADQGTAGGNYVASFNSLDAAVTADAPDAEFVWYATGAEWTGDDTLDKSDTGSKYSWAAAMQYSANANSRPMTSYYFSPRACSAFGRIQSGDDTTEGPVHPATILDMQMWAEQTLQLSAGSTRGRDAGRYFRYTRN